MRSTPWAAYTPGMVLDLLGFVVVLFLVLFGLTLFCVGGFFCFRIVREYFRGKPFAAFEKKAAAAIQAADMGWLAIVCGPLVPVFIFLPSFLVSLFLLSTRRKSARNVQNAACHGRSRRGRRSDRGRGILGLVRVPRQRPQGGQAPARRPRSRVRRTGLSVVDPRTIGSCGGVGHGPNSRLPLRMRSTSGMIMRSTDAGTADTKLSATLHLWSPRAARSGRIP